MLKFRLILLKVIIIFTCGCGASVDIPDYNSRISLPEAGIERLKDGNSRFVNSRSIHPNQTNLRREATSSGQTPFAIIVSCSDSRVPPEIIFDQGIGDLFVVRTAGNVVDSAALASIEYAAEHLHAGTLLVMGHESCGAVKAAMHTPPGKSAGSPALDALVGNIFPNIKNYEADSPKDPDMHAAVCAHVDAVSKSLLASSRIIRELAERKKLYFASGIYSLKTGSVKFWAEGYPETHQPSASHSQQHEHASHLSRASVGVQQRNDPALKR